MRGVDKTRQTIVWIHVNGNHQVESQEGEIGQVVLSQSFASEMGVNAAQSAEAIYCDTNTLEVGKLNASIVTHHDVFNMSAAIDERADLSPNFM
jgi:tetrahydromethanopterin S-methyltransferase subunit A